MFGEQSEVWGSRNVGCILGSQINGVDRKARAGPQSAVHAKLGHGEPARA